MSYDSIEIPDSITPIIGYRGWIYKNGALFSCFRSVEWPTEKALKSECIHPTFGGLREKGISQKKTIPHSNPIKDCTCGIYSLHEFPNSYNKDDSGNRVRAVKPWPHYALSGITLNWGHVVMGEKGLRAEFSKPAAIFSRPRSKALTPIIEELAENYNIKIIDLKEIKKNGYREA